MKIVACAFIILITPLFLFSQEEITLFENSYVFICGRSLYLNGIWIDDGKMKADISNYAQQNSKPITGGYKTGDTIDIKKGCKYYIKIVQKFGLASNSGYVILTDKLEPTDYLGMRLSTLNLYEKFNIGNSEWIVKNITKDNAEFEIEEGLNKKLVTLSKGDMIWKGFGSYYISDILANATDKLSNQLTIELKEVKDYSYLSQKRSKTV